MSDEIKIETVHTITLPLYPPPPPEANAFAVKNQVIYLSAELARELYTQLALILGE